MAPPLSPQFFFTPVEVPLRLWLPMLRGKNILED
jgi:hypothetical protein